MNMKNNLLYRKKISFLYKILKFLKFNILILSLICINTKIKKIIKVCVCSIGKEENRYIREFIQHYKKYDFDKIILYDNNDIQGERFEDIIPDYIKEGFVDLINYRGIITPQISAYNDCYKKNSKYYNWLFFIDIDEFIYLKDFKSIKLFLKDKRFKKCQRIQFNYILHTDNNLIFYDNRTLKERFPEMEANVKNKNKDAKEVYKSIIKGNIHNIKIICPHILSTKPKNCDGFGKKMNISLMMNKPDYEYYYIDHYYSKSTEEFIEKINKTDVFFKYDVRMNKIRSYFSFNKITKKKIDYIENQTGINLTEFRIKLNKILSYTKVTKN